MLAPPSRLHPSPRADVEQVWRTNPLKIPCGHVPKPNQFFHSYFFCAPPLPRSASTTASAPVPAPAPLLPPLLAVGATYSVLCESVLFIRIACAFALVACPSLSPAHVAAKRQGRRNHAHPRTNCPGYNSESIVMVLAACKFFFIISY